MFLGVVELANKLYMLKKPCISAIHLAIIKLTYWLQAICLHGSLVKRVEKSPLYRNNDC